jgi:hypothetical protein
MEGRGHGGALLYVVDCKSAQKAGDDSGDLARNFENILPAEETLTRLRAVNDAERLARAFPRGAWERCELSPGNGFQRAYRTFSRNSRPRVVRDPFVFWAAIYRGRSNGACIRSSATFTGVPFGALAVR